MRKKVKWFVISLVGILVIIIAFTALTFVRYNRFGLYPSGGVLSENQQSFDITSYDISIAPDAKEKSLSGQTIVSLQALKDGLKEIQLQLIDNFIVSSVVDDEENSLGFQHTDGLITVQLAKPLANGESTNIDITYAGKPVEAIRPPWVGGINWSKDEDGNDWIGLSCQGEGGKIWFPCKDHPSDEPDSVFLHVIVPEPYFCAANGLLENSETENGFTTFHWVTRYPINNYCINFSIGMYEPVEAEYTTDSGETMPVIFYVLPQSREGAEKHVAMAIDMLETYRKFYGEYPFAREKFGLVETDYLGMEHQTINAYGNKYRYGKIFNSDLPLDWLMLHEMGHEWWGNKVTAKDWSHFWIHEGICSYGEALYQLDKSGEDAYHDKMAQTRKRIRNKSPIVIHSNATTTEAYNGDIYAKGAYVMHTLRYVLQDSLFFAILKEFATDPTYTYKNLVETEDFIQLVNQRSGMDLRPLLDMYLRTTDLPTVQIDSLEADKFAISIPNIDFQCPMEVTHGDKSERMLLGKDAVFLNSRFRPIVDEVGWYLKTDDL